MQTARERARSSSRSLRANSSKTNSRNAMRTCLYARYSTEHQSPTSIADQLRAGRERAAREGWAIAMVHADEGISGATPVALRAGGKALLADALADRFDIL